MAKYGAKAGEKVEQAMHEMHEGTLTSGRSGKKVTSKKQAIAIGLSEAKAEGGKVPKKAAAKKCTAAKKTTTKKTATKKSTAEKATAKKTTAKKSTAKKAATKKSTATKKS